MRPFRSRITYITGVLGLGLVSVAAHAAAEVAVSDSKTETASEGGSSFQLFNFTSAPPDTGYRLHANLGGGYGLLSGEGYDNSPSGGLFLGTLSFGKRLHRWEWDAGLGWSFSKRAGLDSFGNEMSIRIRSARLDASARYRVLRNLQVGPVLVANFGTDTNFDMAVRNSAETYYGGLRATMDVARLGPVAMEAWTELLTEFNNFGRDAFTGVVGLRFSLPTIFKKEVAAVKKDIRIVLDANHVFFRTDSARVREDLSNALGEVATVLEDSPTNWERIEISGHADARGPADYNKKLSERRAKSVAELLTTKGVDQARIRTEAHGFEKPIDPEKTPIALAKNRRVEVTIKNVANPEKILKTLEPLKAGPVLYPAEKSATTPRNP